MELIDWLIIFAVLFGSLVIGLIEYRRSALNSVDFFLGKRGFVWWILGISMVATTFSTDTPNLVANLVRQNGVSGNWVWWAFLLTGMLTVFVYAKFWRRAEVLTDIEFYELRYSGKSAAFLRIFRALYLGLIFNTFIMAAVNLAAIKIFGVLLGLDPWLVILVGSVITLSYSTLGGLRAVILTDVFQFFLAMIGSILACIYLVNMDSIGGLSAMLSHPNVADKLSFIPTKEAFVAAFIVPLFISWWAAYYPGSEPGGGGYIAQRMFSAKDEKNAVKATLFFTFAHYGLRPWPWIMIALASLIIFPNLASLQLALPQIDSSKIADDIAYPAMLQFLPPGLLGLVVASLVAAYMSTISTHINLGASYLTNDFYKRFLRPKASGKQQVFVGRMFSIIITILAAILALTLTSAQQIFNLLLMLGAGSGAIFILRWFWWRINAVSEIAAMFISLFISIIMAYFVDMPAHEELIIGVSLTTIGWILCTLFTKPSQMKTLYAFCKKIQVGGPGWKSVYKNAKKEKVSLGKREEKWEVPRGILCAVFGCLGVYGMLFATGYFIMSKFPLAILWTLISVVSFLFISRLMKKLSFQ